MVDITYVTLSILAIIGICMAYQIIRAWYSKEKKYFSTLNQPLKNKGKWWYNKKERKKKNVLRIL